MAQPWMWLIVGIPATTVVAGMLTLFIAIQHADPVLDDGHRKAGLGIVPPPGATSAPASMAVPSAAADPGRIAITGRGAGTGAAVAPNGAGARTGAADGDGREHR